MERFIALVLFCLSPLLLLHSQEPTTVIRKTVSEVELAVVATDGAGRLIPDLSPASLTVLDDGRRIPEFGLRPASTLPLRVAILLDVSDSTQATWASYRTAVTDFLKQLMQPRDQVVLLAFDGKVEFERTISDPRQVEEINTLPRRNGQTALFDTVVSACEHDIFSDTREPRRSALIVLSDGEDNISWRDQDAAIEKAELAGVAVYTITLHESWRRPRGDWVLHSLASATGGRDFVVNKQQGIHDALSAISGYLRSFYVLNYRAPGGSKKREFRHVQLLPNEATGQHLQYKAGYFAMPEP